MSHSRSFDRASTIYDQTRPLIEPIVRHGIPAILDVLGPGARVLEAGCGTGRISIPLLERGVNWIGCDLSFPMLRRFQEKFSSARIVQADASVLPFHAASFDAVLTVHVMHLIPTWRETIREFRRVLVSGGAYLNMQTWAPVGKSVGDQIRTFWRDWMSAQGVDAGHVGVRRHEDFLQELDSLGAHIAEVEAIRFPHVFHLGQELERFSSRTYSETWDIPEPIFDRSIQELRVWMNHEYGDLNHEVQDEVRCVIQVARFAD